MTLLVVLGISKSLLACNVPVFRYALERWHADPYEVILFHDRPLSPKEQAYLKPILDAETGKTLFANVTLLQLSKEEAMKKGEFRDILQAEQSQAKETFQFPWVSIRFPYQTQILVPLWSGPLKELPTERLLTSSLRTELSRRLLTGDSAVWLVLSSGNREEDRKIQQLLKSQLSQLQDELTIPQLTQDDQKYLSGEGPPLQLKFSLLPFSSDDESERHLIQMMIAGDEELVERLKTEPLIIPVFGRGRALTVLTASEIREGAASSIAEFLVGPCSCQVKDQNPGFDLLLSADWDGLISGQYTLKEVLPPDLASLNLGIAPLNPNPAQEFDSPTASQATAKSPSAKTSDDKEISASSEENRSSSLFTSLALLLVVCMFVVVGASLVMRPS